MQTRTTQTPDTRRTMVRYGSIALMATGVGAAMSAISFSITDLIGETPARLLGQYVGGVSALILVAMIIMRGMSGHPPNRVREWALAIGATLAFTALMATWATLVRDRPPGFGLYAEQPWWIWLERSQVTQRELLVRGWQLGFATCAVAFYLITKPAQNRIG